MRCVVTIILSFTLLLLSGCKEEVDVTDCVNGEVFFEGECVTDFTPVDYCDVIVTSDDVVIGEINGYTIKRDSKPRCEMILGLIEVDGYNFGWFTSGCGRTLDWIGYSAEKDDIEYSIQSLVDEGEFTTGDIYNLYLCDEARMGSIFILDYDE